MSKEEIWISAEKVEYDYADDTFSHFLKDESFSDYPSVQYLDEKYGSKNEIPLDVFSSRFTPLETIVKYAKDSLQLSNREISELIGRDVRTIQITYRRVASKRLPPIKNKENSIPFNIFIDTNLSIFELLVSFLKDRGLNYSEISRLLGKDPRTIWTIYARYRRKKQVMMNR